MHHQTDIIIIGAGPVGLFSVFQCGMLGFRCHVIDALEVIGGQCSALYPDKPIYDIPGFPTVTGASLVENLAAQIAPFNPVFHLNQQVVALRQLDAHGQSWSVKTSKGVEIQARSIIVAAGVGAFGPNRPPLANIEEFEGTSVFYAIRSSTDFKERRVVIAGGGDAAVDWAIALADVAQKVYVVHRRDKFRAMPESETRLRALAEAGKVELVIPYQLQALHGDNGQLAHVEVTTLTGEGRMLPADTLLPFFGLSMNLGPIAEWGLGLERNHILVDPATAATNRPGVYAIGDIATYPHKLKLILCGFAEAAQAAHAIRQALQPNEIFHFEYSTTKGVPLAA
jgi:thioredoxin reductase (NADPH)